MRFSWYGTAFSAYVTDAMQRSLMSAAEFGRSVWNLTAPIGTDPRTSGDLRRSWWDDGVVRIGEDLSLSFGAATRYAIYVELGTSKMAPRAPVRTVAGEMVAILPSYFANELKG
jgi:hypothetical protein